MSWKLPTADKIRRIYPIKAMIFWSYDTYREKKKKQKKSTVQTVRLLEHHCSLPRVGSQWHLSPLVKGQEHIWCPEDAFLHPPATCCINKRLSVQVRVQDNCPVLICITHISFRCRASPPSKHPAALNAAVKQSCRERGL